METKIQEPFVHLADSIFAYLPNLLGGLFVLLLGWLAAWIVKKILVQVSLIVHLDRFLGGSPWATSFSRADVRYSLYNLIGNIGYAVVFLIFLDNALLAWKLDMLSGLLSAAILFLPKVIIAVLIFGTGWLLASWAAVSVLKALYREDVPRASLIAAFVRSILLLFFSAISLVELDVAREIVIIGFTTIFVTLGAVVIVLSAVGGKDFLARIGQTLKGKE